VNEAVGDGFHNVPCSDYRANGVLFRLLHQIFQGRLLRETWVSAVA
jgi:hypothetical protein